MKEQKRRFGWGSLATRNIGPCTKRILCVYKIVLKKYLFKVLFNAKMIIEICRSQIKACETNEIKIILNVYFIFINFIIWVIKKDKVEATWKPSSGWKVKIYKIKY